MHLQIIFKHIITFISLSEWIAFIWIDSFYVFQIP